MKIGIVRRKMIARREKVRELYADDLQISVIAEILGVSQPTIYKDLIAMGLRFKGQYSDAQKRAISKGIRKRNARDKIDYNTKPFCCVCGKPAMRKKYRKEYYCGDHLITAGDHDPGYENKQREAAGDRFASPGKTAGVW